MGEMFKLPNVPHLLKINLIKLRKVKSFPGKVIASFLAYNRRLRLLLHLIGRYKILILILILLSLVVAVLIQLRNNYIPQIKIAQVENSSLPSSNFSPIPDSTEVASDGASFSGSSVLGTTTDSTTFIPTPIYYPSPIPIPTYKPTPTPTPQPTSTPTPVTVSTNSTTTVSSAVSSSSSTHTCSSMGVSPGVPIAWYSQASSPQTVDSTATINIELRDCNNNIAPVTDTLTITQSSGPGTTVNGGLPPISIETRNGQASFTVKSQTSGTTVYIVRNTSKSFNVTDPSNKHPKVTFNISTPTPSPSPSPAASTPTISPTPNPSPISSASPTPILTPSPSPI